MEFNYYYDTIAMASIDVEDIGNCAIEAHTDLGEFYYLLIRTNLGTSTIVTYGPIVPDIDLLPKVVNCRFERIEFKDTKLVAIINKFLTNPYYKITSAIELEYEEAVKNCRDIIDYVKDKEDNY